MKFLKGFVRRFATAFSIASILAVTAVGGLVYAATQFPTGVAGDTSVGSVVTMWWNGTAAVPANATNPLPMAQSTIDPCLSPAVLKATVPISLSGAGTTQLVPVSGILAVYVCGGALSIAPSATSADSALFEYGTSTDCTGTHALTGTFGSGDLTTTAPPLAIHLTSELVTPASQGFCIVAAGTTVNIQGYITYVQQ